LYVLDAELKETTAQGTDLPCAILPLSAPDDRAAGSVGKASQLHRYFPDRFVPVVTPPVAHTARNGLDLRRRAVSPVEKLPHVAHPSRAFVVGGAMTGSI
jgi:hypothetical protein